MNNEFSDAFNGFAPKWIQRIFQRRLLVSKRIFYFGFESSIQTLQESDSATRIIQIGERLPYLSIGHTSDLKNGHNIGSIK
ncbi:hypothetical protein Agabi119p4_2533 [Agaricus bisporus var. burnettii]|uniref:Uncharacterized protein n=1 Tax=Agaricus bisporus var. burnettii TaxID=192524 RepID=A0A8H7F9E0_AGABI|nr:hypothetical protein Agabi119p4_2533 [Agaricus bisporus var. burnettii]